MINDVYLINNVDSYNKFDNQISCILSQLSDRSETSFDHSLITSCSLSVTQQNRMNYRFICLILCCQILDLDDSYFNNRLCTLYIISRERVLCYNFGMKKI